MTPSLYPIHRLERDDPRVPPALWQVPRPPEAYYAQGSESALRLLQALPERGFAIVGTRHPQRRSLEQVREVVSELRGSHLIVISGFARGIDAEAHEGAIRAGLPTIAILGAGHHHPYPRENFRLWSEILDSGGLLLSEFPPDQPPRPPLFIQRNRLIAGFSQATWIVEASFQSGALNTACWAREQNRICFATPTYPGDPCLAGNQLLLTRDQARPLWDSESLGSVWLELAARLAKDRRGRKQTLSTVPATDLSDPELLAQKVEELTGSHGGAQVQQLLDWTLGLSWSPERFFAAFSKTLDNRWLLEDRGILVSSRNKTL